MTEVRIRGSYATGSAPGVEDDVADSGAVFVVDGREAVEVGEDSRPLFEQLLREGVIVRPLSGFGAPGGLRVTVGTPEENTYCAEALGRVLAQTAS